VTPVAQLRMYCKAWAHVEFAETDTRQHLVEIRNGIRKGFVQLVHHLVLQEAVTSKRRLHKDTTIAEQSYPSPGLIKGGHEDMQRTYQSHASDGSCENGRP